MATKSNKETLRLEKSVEKELREGWVSSSYGELCKVWDEENQYTCWLAGRLHGGKHSELLGKSRLVVGDRVKFEPWKGKKGLVLELIPRKNELSRQVINGKHGSSRGKIGTQLMAANIEHVLIVASAISPLFSYRLVDRLLAAIKHANLQPLLCITKLDLVKKGTFNRLTKPYLKLGLKIRGVITPSKEGIKELEALLRKGNTIMVGHSGAGKTSLSNVLCGVENRVGEISRNGHGCHTTSASQLLPLLTGGLLIDSPGIREFGPGGIQASELGSYYPGVSNFAVTCGFRNCLHRHEPRCAVQEAVANGQLETWRWKDYLELLEELS